MNLFKGNSYIPLLQIIINNLSPRIIYWFITQNKENNKKNRWLIMFNFIRRYQLPNLKIKLLILYLLNISDISLTIILVNTGLIIEANPLMANIITNSIATFFIKVLLPAVLFIYLYIRLKTATVKMIKLTNYCLIGLLGFYLIINVLHLVWFLMLPFFV